MIIRDQKIQISIGERTRMEIDGRPVVQYPCEWTYKIIGTDTALMRAAVEQVIIPATYVISASKTSSGGRYESLNVDVVVFDEAERDGYFRALKGHGDIRMVM